MASKKKIIGFLIILYVMANFAVYKITEVNKSQRIKIALDAKINQLKMHYDILIDQQTKMANAVFKLTMENKDIESILLKATRTNSKQELHILRTQLKKSLSYRYGILKKRGVSQYHIVLPNNKSFLRMHKPQKFGDDLVNIRFDMALVNKNKKIIRGFHQGRTAHGFRNIYPIFNNKRKYLGAIEISFASSTFQNNLKHISKVHTHFLVNKMMFKTHSWKNKDLILNYEQSAEHQDYMITIGGIHTRERCIVRNAKKLAPMRDDINNNILLGKAFSLYNPWQDGIQTATFFPIKNSVTEEIAAWIVSYEQSPFIETTVMGGKIIRIVTFFGLMLLFYFIYRTLNQKDILDIQVQEKTKELNTKAELLSITARELEISEHELEKTNKNLAQKVKEEVDKNNTIQKQLYKSERMASMGEMIGNIAHQWRQPLSVISTSSTSLIMQEECGILDKEFLIKACENINNNAQFLSQTIEDFTNYIKGDRQLLEFVLKDNIDSFINLIQHTIKKENIELVLKIQENLILNGYPNELIQCMINIFNNAKDALVGQNKKLIIILVSRDKNNIVIVFKDNAGGIPKDIIGKIFDPYFTTKHQSQGTGLGLHMTYNLITEGMDGKIDAQNITYIYKDHEYVGAQFTITLPLS